MNRLLFALFCLTLCFQVKGQANTTSAQDTIPPAPFRAEWPFQDSATLKAPRGSFIDDFRLVNTSRKSVWIQQLHARGFQSKTERFPNPATFALEDSAKLPYELKPGTSIGIQVSAKIDKSDTLAGRYQITWAPTKDATGYPYLLSRTWMIAPQAVPSPIFFKVEEVKASRWECKSLPITIIIRDTTQKGGRIRHPSFLIREKEGEALYETRKKGVQFSYLKDNQAIPWPDDSLLAIPPRGSLTVQMVIQGLKPGKGYEGELQFAAQDGKEVGTPFTIYYARSVWLALGVIFGGVVVAALLRWLLDQQERLKQQKRFAELLEEVDAMVPKANDNPSGKNNADGKPKSPVDQPVLDIQAELMDNIRRAKDNCKLAPMKEEDFATTEQSIVEWIKLFRDWMKLRKRIAESADFKDNETIKTAMKAVEDFLLDPKGDTSDAKTKLNEVRTEINKIILAKLQESAAKDEEGTRSGDLQIKRLWGNQLGKWFQSGQANADLLLAEKQDEDPTVIRRTLARNLFLAEITSNAITLVVASIGGLLVLWWGDNTWGSIQDILTAFFWGFGVNSLLKEGDFKRGTAGYLANRIRGKGDE